MKVKALLLSTVILLFFSGITFAQTLYTGTFTNITHGRDGIITMSMTTTPPDISGYINFSAFPGETQICGAGFYEGQIVSDSFYVFFSSHDTEAGCGYDADWFFSLKGKFYQGTDSIAGEYLVHTAGEGGFFNMSIFKNTTSVRNVDKQKPVIYPNPAGRQFVIKLPEYSIRAEAVITDQLGKKVLSKPLVREETTINLDVANGIYFLNIITPEMSSTQKLVIRN